MNEKAPAKRPLMSRFRDAFLGERSSGTDAIASVAAFSARASLDTFEPPPEIDELNLPTDLLPAELPWELRDDESRP